MIGSLTVRLPGANGTLTLSGTFNAFDLVGDERTFVFALLDLMQDFEAKHRDPIASAVRAELQPLEDALIDAGHKLAKDSASGWQCDLCGTFVVGTSIDLQAVVCGCGRGKGRWGVVLAPAEVKSSAEKESA